MSVFQFGFMLNYYWDCTVWEKSCLFGNYFKPFFFQIGIFLQGKKPLFSSNLRQTRPAEGRLRVREFLATLKTCWWPSAVVFFLWSGCCLFGTFPISILNFINITVIININCNYWNHSFNKCPPWVVVIFT